MRPDTNVLTAVALATAYRSMWDVSDARPNVPETWWDVPVAVHLSHACAHVECAMRDPQSVDTDGLLHAAHAMLRLAFVQAQVGGKVCSKA
jgi:hypothetical protein